MNYSKPEVHAVASSLAGVQNTSSTKGTCCYLETADLPLQHYTNTKPPPAYEADE